MNEGRRYSTEVAIARKKLVNHLRKSGLGLVEINKLLVDCGYRKGK
jgi:DNA-binding transcriptional MerR regulator